MTKFKRHVITKSIKIYVFIVIFLFSIGISTITMFYATGRDTNQDFYSDIGNPKSSFEISLEYNHYVTVYATAGSGDRLHWSFSGTNTYVGITVVVMDSSNFNLLQANLTFEMEILSDGSYYSRSGDYYPAYSSTWYFLFWNYDDDQQTTYLTYDVEIISGGPDITLILVIVSVVSVAVIAVIIVVIVLRRKSKRKAELGQAPIEKPVEEKLPITAQPVKPIVEKPPITSAPVKPIVEKPPIITPPVKPIVEKPPITTLPVKPAKVKQPTITKIVKPQLKFCTICGSEVKGKFCRRCGVEISKPKVDREKVIQDIQKVFQVSGIRIDLEMLKDILPVDDSEFKSKIFDLADQFGFKIELEILHVTEEKKESFINALIDELKV